MSKTNNFGDVFPPRNLGQGDPWGRHQEVRVVGLERSLEGVSQEFRNEQRVLSARAELQADQMKALARQQDILDEQQQALASQQGVLQSQQAQLQSQQDQLTTIVNSIPVTLTRSGSSTNFSLPNGTYTVVSILIPVPEGKTQASVFAFGQALFYSGDVPQANIAAWRISIAGVNGPFGHNVPLNMDVKSVSVSSARDYTDIGSTVAVNFQAVSGQAHPPFAEGRADLFVSASFS